MKKTTSEIPNAPQAQKKKRRFLWAFLPILLYIAITLAGAFYTMFSLGNPVVGAVLLALGLVISLLSLLSRRGSAFINRQAARARSAVREEKSFSLPRGAVFRNTLFCFLFSWLFPPALVLLPGNLWLIASTPLLVIGILRAVKFYPAFEDLGVPKGKFFALHFLAYLFFFILFFLLKYLVFETI